MKVFTIGVYGSTEDGFFFKLKKNGIDTFVDVRRRRGVRGAKYAFVNSRKLQEKLKDLKIDYRHILDLAPSNEIRNMQKLDDQKKKVLKRERQCMGDVFRLAYQRDILNNFDLRGLVDSFEENGSKNIVFFCVEEQASACHRSLVIKRLVDNYNFKAVDL